MDYEREPDSGLGASPSESDTSATTDDAATAADDTGQDAATETAADTASHDANGYATNDAPDVTNTASADADSTSNDVDGPADSADSASISSAAHDAAGVDPAQDAYSDTGFGTDADVMDDSFASAPQPPEWPAADLVASSDVTHEPFDMGDDSDAPIVDDAAAPALAPAMDANVRADHVNISQSGAQSIEASSVTFSQGGVGRVNADDMSVEQSGVGLARVKTLKLGDGASAFAVVADEATVEEGSNTFLLVSRSVNGEVGSTIDWRAALAFGAGLGLALSIIRRLR